MIPAPQIICHRGRKGRKSRALGTMRLTGVRGMDRRFVPRDQALARRPVTLGTLGTQFAGLCARVSDKGSGGVGYGLFLRKTLKSASPPSPSSLFALYPHDIASFSLSPPL